MSEDDRDNFVEVRTKFTKKPKKGNHAFGRYCLKICYCGECPQYTPPKEPK